MKISQEQFGQLLGRTKGNVSAWEKGRHEPSYEQLRQISKRSGVPLPGIVLPPTPESPEVERMIMAFGWLTEDQKTAMLADLESKAETNKAISRQLGPRWDFKPDAAVARTIKPAPKAPPAKKHKKAGHDGGRPPSAPLDDYPED